MFNGMFESVPLFVANLIIMVILGCAIALIIVVVAHEVREAYGRRRQVLSAMNESDFFDKVEEYRHDFD